MSATSQPAQSTPPADPAASRRSSGGALSLGKRFLTLREGSIIVVTIIAAVYFASQTSRFLTTGSFQTLLPFFAPYAIIAAGEVFVMINGEIDLSVGTMGLFTAFWFHDIHSWGIPLVPALILALASALALGAFNGFMTAYVGISSFVTTLGMLFFLGGLTLVLSHSTQVNLPGTSILGKGTFESIFGRGTYAELFWAVGIVLVLQVILSFTRWGLHTVAVGSNRIGAAEAGIKVRGNLMRNFMMCAMLAGLAGILENVRAITLNPDPSATSDYLFLSISAAVIGGTLLRGGSGTVIGAFIGALFLGVLTDGLTLIGTSADHRDLYLGLAIVLAMVINTYVTRVRTGAAGHG
jgi:simple sugar transport system permease protein